MKLRASRTTVATVLTVLAVTVPCAAWYAVGSREAAGEARRISEQPTRAARDAAARAADRLALRLEGLRQIESRRPFEHYATAASPTAIQPCACEGPSPLAQGLGDPLARAHFQIDALGRLSLPGLREDPAIDREAVWSPDRQEVLDSLECSAAETLPASTPPADAAAKNEDDLILVGPFLWQTLRLDGEPTLVAVREVQTPVAVLTQGFVVAGDRLEREVLGGPFDLRLAETAPAGAIAAAVPIEGARWLVVANADTEVRQAELEARSVKRRFLTTFLFGSLGALFAGVFVIGMVRQSERVAAERSRFAAVAAHELRTPLAGVRMYGEMLAEGLDDPGKRRRYSRRIADEADRLGRVVDNVLGYTRLERGSLELNVRPGDLAACIETAVAGLQPALEASGMRVELAIDGALPPVGFDPDAVSRTLQNLLDNADKHTRQAERRLVAVGVRATGEGVEVTVRDHGPGVPEELRRRMFLPFVRRADTGGPGGIGLGLAMARELTRAQGGRLDYEPAPGGGALFRLVFPTHVAA